MKLLMVCLGNICRSPLAEGIMQSKIDEYTLPWEVDSAGTGSWHAGEKPDSRSVKVANKYSLDITAQRARQFSLYDFRNFDLIFAMDTSNYNDILKLRHTEEEAQKVTMILNEIYPNENRSVPDPYWDNDGFEKVYKMLDTACEQIVEKYK